jgi:hypothetical protein
MGLTFDEERDQGLASLLLRHGRDLANKRACTVVERKLCKRCGEGAAIWERERSRGGIWGLWAEAAFHGLRAPRGLR